MFRKVSIIVGVFLVTSFVFAQTAGDFEYGLDDEGDLWITEYTGTASKVTIPARLGGRSVYAIAGGAFYENETLTSVVLSEGIQGIDDGYAVDVGALGTLWLGAFEDCTKLSSVKLPASLVYIGIHAFTGCSSLTGITIPKNVFAIGAGAFSYSGLKKFVYNGNIDWIEEGTFGGCESLTSVDLKGIEGIGPYAFEDCTALKTVTMPATITEIGKDAFAGCTSLTTIKIPSSVRRINIAPGAFAGCPLNAASIALLKQYGYTHAAR